MESVKLSCLQIILLISVICLFDNSFNLFNKYKFLQLIS
jgi:hypothetical protein